jgi:hypothetical protein
MLFAAPICFTLIGLVFSNFITWRRFYVAHLGVPWSVLAGILTMFSPILLVFVPVWFLERRAIRQAGGNCPKCGRSILYKWRHVVASGSCPYCRAAIFEGLAGGHFGQVD